MKEILFVKTKISGLKIFSIIAVSAAVGFFGVSVSAQKNPAKMQVKKAAVQKPPAKTIENLPKVTQIDTIALQKILKREGENAKPLLINFWATWCAPCVEEFPDLVKIAADYKDKIDVITVSLDDLAEITRDVPKFLAKQKAEMPAYLLKSDDEEVAIKLVADTWQGGLPFTGLYDKTGKLVYGKQGKFTNTILRREIDNLLQKTAILQKSNSL